MTELEIGVGKHLNSFKKIFKKFARETQRGSVSSDFGNVSSAIAYEKDPVKKFLSETEGNPEILALLQELINLGDSELNLKQKDINNLSRALKNIQSGKVDDDKKEWHDLHKKREEDESSPEFSKINDELTVCEKELKEIDISIDKIEEGISRRKKEHSNALISLEERKTRASDITNNAIDFQN